MSTEPERVEPDPSETGDEERPGEAGGGDEELSARERALHEREQRLDALERQAQDLLARAANATAAHPAATPPTTQDREVAELQAVSNQLAHEASALEERVAREGWTAENIVRRQDLVDRRSELRGRATILAVQRAERERQVTQAGSEEEWTRYVDANPGVPLAILRKAFLHDRAQQTPPPPMQPKKPSVPDLSGGSEVTAPKAKARTMTEAEVEAEQARLHSEGRHADAREIGRQVRTGKIIVKSRG